MADVNNSVELPFTLCKICKHNIPIGAIKCIECSSYQTSFCKVCKTGIPMEAIKCSACNSYQDWRNIFGISNTALALLVAIISISAQSVPLLKELLTPIGENVEVLIPTQVYSEKADIYFYNTGRVPAIVENDMYLKIDGIKGKNFFLPETSSTFLIEPNKTTHMTFEEKISNYVLEGDYHKCEIHINIRRLNGSIRALEKIFDCKWHYRLEGK